MPTSVKSELERKRRVVALGTLQGNQTTAIAQAAGCGERHVRTLRAEAATQVLMRDLLRPHREDLCRLIPEAISAVERALQAQKNTPSDLAAQMLAVGRVLDLLRLAQDAAEPAPVAGVGHLTYQEIEPINQKNTSKSEPERKRRVVALGALQGSKTAAIAQEAGCGERHVRTIQAEPATQVLIGKLLRPRTCAA